MTALIWEICLTDLGSGGLGMIESLVEILNGCEGMWSGQYWYS